MRYGMELANPYSLVETLEKLRYVLSETQSADAIKLLEQAISKARENGPYCSKLERLFAIYGWNTLIFNQSRQLRRSRSRLECEVRTQPFQTHSWLELLSLKGLSDVLRFPLYGRVLHTAFWPE